MEPRPSVDARQIQNSEALKKAAKKDEALRSEALKKEIPKEEVWYAPLTLIGKTPANRKLRGVRDRLPATDDRARILTTPLDGEVSGAIHVNAVNPVCVDNKGVIISEFPGGFLSARKIEWNIMFTDDRILFWSPHTIDTAGRKINMGNSVTCGHIRYQWIEEIVVSNDVNPPALSISAATDAEGSSKTICMVYDSPDALNFLLRKLAAMILESKDKLKIAKKEKLRKNVERLAKFDWNGKKMLMIFSFPYNYLWVSGK